MVPSVMKAEMTALVGEKLKSPSKVTPGDAFVAGLANSRFRSGACAQTMPGSMSRASAAALQERQTPETMEGHFFDFIGQSPEG